MMGIKKVVAGSRNRKREKKMNATTNAKTRNVYVREIMMPVVFCKDCKYMKVHGWNPKKEVSTCHFHCEFWNHAVDDCDFCSRGEKKDE